jgi:hypothetical protein
LKSSEETRWRHIGFPQTGFPQTGILAFSTPYGILCGFWRSQHLN